MIKASQYRGGREGWRDRGRDGGRDGGKGGDEGGGQTSSFHKEKGREREGGHGKQIRER